MNNKMTSVFGKPIGRRMILAGGAALMALAGIFLFRETP